MLRKCYLLHETRYRDFANPADFHCWVTGEKLDPLPVIDSRLFDAIYDKINSEVQKENPPYRVYSGGMMFDHECQMKLKLWRVLPEKHGEWVAIEFVFDWYTIPILTKDFWTDVDELS